MNYLDKTGLTRLWSKITGKLGQKQDTLVSGTNIKTINNTSLLGAGDIDLLTRNKLFGTTLDEKINYYYAGIKSLENVGITYNGNSFPIIDALEIIAIRPYSGSENVTLINEMLEYIIKYGTVPASVKDNTIFTIEMPGILSATLQLDRDDNTKIDRIWIVNHGWDFAPYSLHASGLHEDGEPTWSGVDVIYIGQNKLVSGENIKTINGTSLLGSGNVDINEYKFYTEGGFWYSFKGLTSLDSITATIDDTEVSILQLLREMLYAPNEMQYLIDEIILGLKEIKIASSAYIDSTTSEYLWVDIKGNDRHSGTIKLRIKQINNEYVFTELEVWGSDNVFHYYVDDFDVSPVEFNVVYDISKKQNKLVSGGNIKTINNMSLLGSGNIAISGGNSTDVQINGTSIVSNDTANIVTNSAYNSSTNKIATMNDVPTNTNQLTNGAGFQNSTQVETAITSKGYITSSNVAFTNQSNSFANNQTFNGGITVNGNITQNGSAYETHAQKVYTTNDYIYLRDGATGGLASGSYAGFQAKKYDGTNDGRLVFGNDGIARVGDVGDEQALATRVESPTNGATMVWDSSSLKMVSGFKIVSCTQTQYNSYTKDSNTIYLING